MKRGEAYAALADGNQPQKPSGRGWLCENARNLNKEVREGKIDRGVGRDKELIQMEIILGKRKKANACLVGSAGVGKTQLFHDLAHLIESEDYNGPLKNYTIYEISVSDLMGGTRYRGDLEEKIKKMMEEATSRDDVILAIDELHTIMSGAVTGGIGIADSIKPFLAGGSIKCIGATTAEEWEMIKKDKAMARRFVRIDISELSMEAVMLVMDNIRPNLERHHGILYNAAVIKRIPQVAREYSTISLPDCAIDLADTLGSFKGAHPSRWSGETNSNKVVMEDLISVAILMYGVENKDVRRFIKRSQPLEFLKK